MESWMVATSQCHSQHGGSMCSQMNDPSNSVAPLKSLFPLDFVMGTCTPININQPTESWWIFCLSYDSYESLHNTCCSEKGETGEPLKCKTVKKHQGFWQTKLPVICLRCFWLFWSLRASPTFPSKRPGFFLPLLPSIFCTLPSPISKNTTASIRIEIHPNPPLWPGLLRSLDSRQLRLALSLRSRFGLLRRRILNKCRKDSEGRTNQIQPVHSDMNLPPKCIQV